jgi:hypothetical protein
MTTLLFVLLIVAVLVSLVAEALARREASRRWEEEVAYWEARRAWARDRDTEGEDWPDIRP